MDLGEINLFRVNRQVDFGYYLINAYDEEVLLPISESPKDLKIDDDLEAFVYKDSEDRVIATTLEPLLKIGEFNALRVTQVNQIGAFADWGMRKDLLIPFQEQVIPLQEGRKYVVTMFLDQKSKRLVGTTRIDKFLKKESYGLKDWDQVDILIFKRTDLGYKAVVNQEFEGLIYENEIFEKVTIGDKRKAFVKKVREDGKLDLVLQKPGFSGVEDRSEEILNRLKEGNGFLAFNDKSDPDIIRDNLHMSKKTFKKIIGNLYKNKVITIEENGIRLV